MTAILIAVLLAAALPLVIPAAILLGHRRMHGPMIVAAGVAVGIFAIFWVALGGVGIFFGSADTRDAEAVLALLLMGFFLLLASWTLALHAATAARRYRWVTLLVAAGYLSFVAIVISLALPDPCLFGAGPRFACPNGPNPLAELLALVGYLLAPCAALAYAFLAERAPSLLPDGLFASSVDVQAEDAEGEADKFEMHVERIE